MSAILMQGNALQIPLADESVHCVVTSPPYFSLRSYNLGEYKKYELGLEATLQEYLDNMVAVFREVRRVLRSDGVLWLNMGDSYAGGGRGAEWAGEKQSTNAGSLLGPMPPQNGLKPKDLMGVPWRLALALQADGWWLRSDIIWHKPNPMPESVTDRPTKAHEYIFLLTKSARYFYDADAVMEGVTGNSHSKGTKLNPPKKNEGRHENWHKLTPSLVNCRNKRTVWTVATAPYSGSHFATFPPKLIEPCIKAGTSERGCCSACGTPLERVVEEARNNYESLNYQMDNGGDQTGGKGKNFPDTKRTTTGFRPTCDCDAEHVPCTVYDPFGGSGTTAMVANQLGRVGIVSDLSWEYLQMAKERTGLQALEDWNNGKQAVEANLEALPLFAPATSRQAAESESE